MYIPHGLEVRFMGGEIGVVHAAIAGTREFNPEGSLWPHKNLSCCKCGPVVGATFG